MTNSKGDYTAARGRFMTVQERGDEAQAVRKERRIKALYYMHRTDNMDEAAMALGLTPGPALTSEWREYLDGS